ncbi:MAG: efflux RND transporter periplasmic adaptor subunit [Bacteroidaceae bacterium]
MKKHLKRILWVCTGLLFIGTFVFLYQKSKPKEIVYHTTEMKKSDLKRTTVVTGNLEPRDEVLIKPQTSGIISVLYKQAGDEVKKGEVIAKIKVIPDMNSLNTAESRVRLATISEKQAFIDFERTKQLFEDKLVSKEEYEKSQNILKQAKEEKSTAINSLNITKEGVSLSAGDYSTTLIRSTIDGLILDVPVKVGNSVIMSNTFNDGTTIAAVANMNDLVFRGSIDETEVALLHEGMPVTISIGAVQRKKLNATLEYIAPKINGSQFHLRASVLVPKNIKVRSGYSANAEITLENAKQVNVLSESAVEFKGDSTFVYVQIKENPQSFVRRQIQTGISDGIFIQVKSGLKKGDKVRTEQIIQ